MFLYEVLVILAYLFWSFMVVIISILTAAQIWSTLDARVADASLTVTTAETVLTWDKGIKTFLLSVLAGWVALITAHSFGSTAV